MKSAVVRRILVWVVFVPVYFALTRSSAAGREAVFGWSVLILVLSLCVSGIVQMARDYCTTGVSGGNGARSLVAGVILSRR